MCFFYLLLVVFNSVFTIPVQIENSKLKLSIPTAAPITVDNDAILPVVTDKAINDLSK